jgi:hypothetical protein
VEDGVDDDPEPWNGMKDLENSNDSKNHQEIQSIFVTGLTLLSGMMSTSNSIVYQLDYVLKSQNFVPTAMSKNCLL